MIPQNERKTFPRSDDEIMKEFNDIFSNSVKCMIDSLCDPVCLL